MKRYFINKERNTYFTFIKTFVDSDGKEEIVGMSDDYLFSCPADDTSKKKFLLKNHHYSYQTEEEN